MLICAAGDIHGSMDRLYQDVFAFEASLGILFDYVLHVGDFGIWPDPSRIDKATRHHDGVGDFRAWLDGRQDPEVPPGLTYLRAYGSTAGTVRAQIRQVLVRRGRGL
jgi:hypothetical protein